MRLLPSSYRMPHSQAVWRHTGRLNHIFSPLELLEWEHTQLIGKLSDYQQLAAKFTYLISGVRFGRFRRTQRRTFAAGRR